MVNKSKKTATNEFYKGLEKLSKEDEDHPENYISLEEILKKYPITEKTDDKGPSTKNGHRNTAPTAAQ